MNSMPFRQLKSFFKILIGVQYHCIAIHPGMPAEYPQKRQSFRLHRCFRCGWPLMCGRQDSSTLWSTRRKRRVATVHWTVAFTWVRARRLYQNKKGARRLLFYSMWKWRNGHNPINARSLDEKEVLGALVFLPFATIEKEIITSNFPTYG